MKKFNQTIFTFLLQIFLVDGFKEICLFDYCSKGYFINSNSNNNLLYVSNRNCLKKQLLQNNQNNCILNIYNREKGKILLLNIKEFNIDCKNNNDFKIIFGNHKTVACEYLFTVKNNYFISNSDIYINVTIGNQLYEDMIFKISINQLKDFSNCTNRTCQKVDDNGDIVLYNPQDKYKPKSNLIKESN